MIEAVKNRLLQLCGERNITINKLATLYGRSKNPKLLTIKMICDGLDITLAEFFNTKEFNELGLEEIV